MELIHNGNWIFIPLKTKTIFTENPLWAAKNDLKGFDEKYFDSETKNFIAIKKVEYFEKKRDLMIAYKEKKQKVVILTIHPLKKSQKDNRIKNNLWKKLWEMY